MTRYMKLLHGCMLLGAVATLLPSCADESPWGDTSAAGEGGIKVNLYSSKDVLSDIPNVRGVGKEDIVAPEAEDFEIKLSKNDGSYSKTWSSISEFAKEHEFSAGTYTLEAFYGNEESQGVVGEDEIGHEHAFYYAVEDDVVVKAGETTNVQLKASLQNSIVGIEYTEAFSNYFPAWETTLQTEGKSILSLGNAEGLVYVVPGDIDIIIKATLQNGNQVTMNPAVFEALPQHMYKIRFNVYEGEIGQAEKLEIIFDDQIDETHRIELDLSDVLLSGEGPTVTPEGFEHDQMIELLEGNGFDGEVKFTVSSPGGIVEAKLTVKTNDENFNPTWLTDNVIDLCSASESDIAAMTAAGIKALGFYNNPDKMALLDLTEFCKNLPVGVTDINLVVKDKASHANEPVTVHFTSFPLEMEIRPNGKVWFTDGWGEVVVSYNGPDPTQPGSNLFSFTVKVGNDYEPVEILTRSENVSTRSFDKKDYIFRIKLPDAARDEFPVKALFNGIERNLETTLEVEYPEYTVEYDPMAKRIRMRVSEYTEKNGQKVNVLENEALRKLFTERARIFVGETELTNEKRITRDVNSGIITVTGFEPLNNYNLKTSIQVKKTPDLYQGVQLITTEDAAGVPNGDFSQQGKHITSENFYGGVVNYHNNKYIQCGGQWALTTSENLAQYTNWAWINIYEPLNWTTLNDLTCWAQSETKNTWFLVPSTFMSNNKVVIRSVGYHHSGSVPALTSSRTGNVWNYKAEFTYCTNTPSPDQLEVSVGELFLGEYEYDGGIHRTNGIAFNTRPTYLSFDYEYNGMNGENAEVIIKIIDEEKGEIYNTAKLASGNISGYRLELPQYNFGKKASTLYISFKSSDSDSPYIKIPTGKDLDEGHSYGNMTSYTNERSRQFYTEEANAYKSLATGSELIISNVKLGYE